MCCLPATFYLLAIKRIPGAIAALPFWMHSASSRASRLSRGAALPLPRVSRAAKPLRNGFQMLQATVSLLQPGGAGAYEPWARFPGSLPEPESRGCPLHPVRPLSAMAVWLFGQVGSCRSATLSRTHRHLSTPGRPRCEVLRMLPPG